MKLPYSILVSWLLCTVPPSLMGGLADGLLISVSLAMLNFATQTSYFNSSVLNSESSRRRDSTGCHCHCASGRTWQSLHQMVQAQDSAARRHTKIPYSCTDTERHNLSGALPIRKAVSFKAKCGAKLSHCTGQDDDIRKRNLLTKLQTPVLNCDSMRRDSLASSILPAIPSVKHDALPPHKAISASDAPPRSTEPG